MKFSLPPAKVQAYASTNGTPPDALPDLTLKTDVLSTDRILVTVGPYGFVTNRLGLSMIIVQLNCQLEVAASLVGRPLQ